MNVLHVSDGHMEARRKWAEGAAVLGRWRYGFFSMVPVGATNVGSIKINFDQACFVSSIRIKLLINFSLEPPNKRATSQTSPSYVHRSRLRQSIDAPARPAAHGWRRNGRVHAGQHDRHGLRGARELQVCYAGRGQGQGGRGAWPCAGPDAVVARQSCLVLGLVVT